MMLLGLLHHCVNMRLEVFDMGDKNPKKLKKKKKIVEKVIVQSTISTETDSVKKPKK